MCIIYQLNYLSVEVQKGNEFTRIKPYVETAQTPKMIHKCSLILVKSQPSNSYVLQG